MSHPATQRSFTAQGDPAWKDGTVMTLELEPSGRVSWRIWWDGQDYGGTSRPDTGREAVRAGRRRAGGVGPLAGEVARTKAPAPLRRAGAFVVGGSVAVAAKAEGVTAATVWGYARYDERFRQQLDEATTAHRTCTPSSRGRPDGYRQGCRCPECRAAHSEETGRYR